MRKLVFEDGVKTSEAKVTIAGTDYQVTPAEYEGTTPLSAHNLNLMQDYMNENVEDETLASQITEEAKEYTITDSAEVNGKIHITGGDTKQYTTTGKNKVDCNNISSVTKSSVVFTPKFNGELLDYIQVKGTSDITYADAYRFNISGLSAGNYIVNGLGTNSIIRYVLLKAGDTSAVVFTTDGDHSFTQDSSSPYTTLRVDVYQTGSVDAKIKPMIRLASVTSDTYEPFTDGFPAPNPDYPQEVISVGSNVNLLENTATTNTVNGVTFTVNEDGTILANGTSTAEINFVINASFAVEENTTYTLSGCPKSGSTSKYMLRGTNDAWGENHYDVGYGVAFIPTKPSAQRIVIQVKNGITLNNILFKPKFIKGAQFEEYTQYNCGSIDFLVRNKNYFLKEGGLTDYYIDINSGAPVSLSGYYTTDFIPVKPNEVYGIYTLGMGSAGKINIAPYDSNRTYIKPSTPIVANLNGFASFTIPSGIKYIRVVCLTAQKDITYLYKNATSQQTYVEGKQQAISIPLPEGMELREIGDYKDYIYRSGNKWYKHNEIGKLILDGTEDWTLSNNVFLCDDLIENRKGNTDGLCNQYVYFGDVSSSGSSGLTDNLKFAFQSTNATVIKRLLIRNNDYDTTSSFASYLETQYSNGTPVIVYYILETPVEEEITDTDTLEALYQIEHFLMYEGYTSIECTNDMQPDIKVEYYYDNDLNKTYAKRLDEIDYTINNLEISGGAGGDSLPVGTEMDFDGDVSDIPLGWEQVDDVPVYSTTETICGTWIDGKPMYRKVVNFGALPNNTTKSSSLADLNIDKMISMRGFAYDSSNGTLPIPYITLTLNMQVAMNYSGGTSKNLVITTGTNRSGYTAYITIEYTKTTDTANS